MGGFHVSLGYIISSLPLSLEDNSFLVPFIDGGGDGVHDVAHQGRCPTEKYLIQTLGSEILARATWFLKVEMYSVKEGEYELFFTFFSMRLVDNQEIAFPVTSLSYTALLTRR